MQTSDVVEPNRVRVFNLGAARRSYRFHIILEGNNYWNYKTTSRKSSDQLQLISSIFYQ